MRPVLLILTLFTLNANATNYYVAASGDDNNIGSQGSPFKTINKVNSKATTGDIIYFNRGDVFFGTILPAANGITYDAYGTGAYPVITAMKQLIFTASGTTNIYNSNSFLPQSNPKLLTINGVVQQIGRWPNASTSYPYGYLNNENLIFNKAADWTELVDNDWGSLTKPTNDFTGAEIAWRVNKYRFSTYQITQVNSGNTATFHIPDYDNSGEVGRGYFLQNHIKCLDLNGEWCWNDAPNTASIYLTSSPSGMDIEMPYLDNVVLINGRSNLTFQHLSVTGANKNGFSITGGNNITIQNCSITNCGSNAFSFTNTTNLTIQNNFVDFIFQFGIKGTSDGQTTILRNTIQRIFPIMGMGAGGNVAGSAIDVHGSNKTISYNYLHDVAYAGVGFYTGSNVLVYKNIIDGYCNRLHDGGAIYCFGDVNFTFRNKVVKQNIAMNAGMEHPEIGTFDNSTNYQIRAMYADNLSNHVVYDGNIVIGGYVGLYANEPISNTWQNNFCWNVSSRVIEMRNYKAAYPSVDNIITNNVVFSNRTTGTGRAFWIETYNQAGISGWGNFNGNYYVRPYTNGSDPFTYYQVSSYSLPAWKTAWGFEASGQLSPVALTSSQNPAGYTRLRVNMSDTVQIYDMGKTEWYTSRGAVLPIGTKLIMQPYTAEGLIYKSGAVTNDDIGSIGGDGTGGSTGGDTGGNGGGPPPPPPPPQGVIRLKAHYKIIHVQ